MKKQIPGKSWESALMGVHTFLMKKEYSCGYSLNFEDY